MVTTNVHRMELALAAVLMGFQEKSYGWKRLRQTRIQRYTWLFSEPLPIQTLVSDYCLLK